MRKIEEKEKKKEMASWKMIGKLFLIMVGAVISVLGIWFLLIYIDLSEDEIRWDCIRLQYFSDMDQVQLLDKDKKPLTRQTIVVKYGLGKELLSYWNGCTVVGQKTNSKGYFWMPEELIDDFISRPDPYNGYMVDLGDRFYNFKDRQVSFKRR